jgi:dihydrofolate reductase
LNDLPTLLKTLGIRSMMVEGGAEIIRQFLQSELHQDSRQGQGGRPLADLLVVTVAPVLVPDGFSVLPSISKDKTSTTTAKTVSFFFLSQSACC